MGKWTVSLKGSPPGTFEADDRQGAIAAYKTAMGIISSVHPFDAREVSADVAGQPDASTRPANGPLSELHLAEPILTALTSAGITNVADVIRYAKMNGGLSGIIGIGQAEELAIRDAVIVWKHEA